MAYLDQWALMMDETFRGRVTMAILHAARQIVGEDPETPNHALRSSFGYAVINNPGSYAPWFLPDIASNPAISAAGPDASLDTDLDFVIASSWDFIAARTTPTP